MTKIIPLAISIILIFTLVILFRKAIFFVIKFKILVALDIIMKIKGIRYGYFIFGGKDIFSYPKWVKLPYIVRKIVDVLALKKVKSLNSERVAIIKLDAIGDYVLFHNFIELLSKSDSYKDKKVILIANLAWKDIFDTFDSDFVYDSFFIDKRLFAKNLIYRYKTLKKLQKLSVATSIIPVFSRDFLFYDTIVANFQSSQNITFDTNYSNISKEEKTISDRFYTKIIPADSKTKFEFDRNREFFEKLLNQNILLKAPFFYKTKIKDTNNFNLTNYAVLFPGASEVNKIWDYKNFYEVGNYLYNKYNLNIVICGGKEDKIYATKIRELSNGSFTDLTGETTLTDMIAILSNAKILISNDTSSVHFAQACDTKTVFVLNGRHFGRFAPYPKTISESAVSIYPKEIVDIDKYFDQYAKEYEHHSALDINSISVESVIYHIDKLLKK